MTDGSDRAAGRCGGQRRGAGSPNAAAGQASDPQVASAKARLRRQMRARMAALSAAAREAASARLSKALVASAAWRASDVVLAFSGTAGEPDTTSVLEGALSEGRLLALPRVIDDGIVFYQVLHLEQLHPGYRGILEPAASAPPLRIGSWRHALLLVPGVAFDIGGRRLGRGGGHYDRYLKVNRQIDVRWRAIGVCFERQLVDEVPVGSHDQSVDDVVTERRWLAGGTWQEYHDPHR